MPRASSPWTWRRMLRDHFDGSQTELLTMLVIGTYMDREGYAFPSQDLIAKGCRSSVRTVRRHIDYAKKTGWIGVTLSGRTGQGWRHQCYQAAVPDDLPMVEADNAISEALTAQVGDPEGPDTAMAARSITEVGTTMEGPDTGSAKVRTNGTKGADKSTTSTGHSYGRLTPALRTPASITHTPEEARLSPSGALSRNQSQEPRVAGPERFARPAGSQEALRGNGSGGSDEADRIRRIKRLLREEPDLQTDWDMAARVMSCSRELVGKAVTEIYAERTTTVEDMPL